MEDKVIINGWVTRSKNSNNIIFSDTGECKRGSSVWYHKEGSNIMSLSGTGLVDNSIFPSVTWESKPKQVKIEITLIEELKKEE